MPQSFAAVHLHVVFSTKLREPTITPDLAPRLRQYLAGPARDHGCRVVVRGGRPGAGWPRPRRPRSIGGRREAVLAVSRAVAEAAVRATAMSASAQPTERLMAQGYSGRTCPTPRSRRVR